MKGDIKSNNYTVTYFSLNEKKKSSQKILIDAVD